MKTLIATILLAALLAAGCTSASAGAAAHPSGAITKAITDRDKGTTITVHVGDHLKLTLASTYWTIHPASNTAVLRSAGKQITQPRLQGCVPGAGCGTATQIFTAIKTGTATVSASRTTCGEVLRCSGGNGSYRVTVRVK